MFDMVGQFWDGLSMMGLGVKWWLRCLGLVKIVVSGNFLGLSSGTKLMLPPRASPALKRIKPSLEGPSTKTKNPY